MEFSLKSDGQKISIVILFLLVALALTYYFHFILHESTVFTHFFYIPIILATLWWQRKGLIVPIGLSILLISTNILSGVNAPLEDDLFRCMMFLIIGAIVAILSREMSKNKQKLLESEERYRSVAQTAVDGMLTTDSQGKIIFVNESLLGIFGYREEELIGKEANVLVIEEHRDRIQDILKTVPPAKHRLLGRTVESIGLRSDGSKFPLEASISNWASDGNHYFTTILRDVTERKMMEEKKNELAAIVESSEDAIYRKDLNGIIKSWNKGAEIIYGYKDEEIVGKPISTLIPEDYQNEFPIIMERILNGEHIAHYETQRLRKDGEIIDISLSVSPTRDADGNIVGASSIARDITEKKLTEKALKQSLKDKEMLIGEIHHRVKNNLMIITSLLSLQSQYIEDKKSRSLFQESENRARSMAVIHEKLYQSGQAKRIDFSEYIQSLGNELYNTYALDTGLLDLQMDLDEGLILDVDTAIPLGLIFNELFTNSLKHAFPDGRKGTIKVSFRKQDDKYILVVEDDGVGLPEDFKVEESDSFGLGLVSALTQQIDAEVDLDSANGTKYTITFREEPV